MSVLQAAQARHTKHMSHNAHVTQNAHVVNVLRAKIISLRHDLSCVKIMAPMT